LLGIGNVIFKYNVASIDLFGNYLSSRLIITKLNLEFYMYSWLVAFKHD